MKTSKVVYVSGRPRQLPPTATPEELEAIAKKNPRTALRHPNATREQLAHWLHWTKRTDLDERLFALEQNPALPLLLLEDASPDDRFLGAYWAAKLALVQEAGYEFVIECCQTENKRKVAERWAIDEVRRWMRARSVEGLPQGEEFLQSLERFGDPESKSVLDAARRAKARLFEALPLHQTWAYPEGFKAVIYYLFDGVVEPENAARFFFRGVERLATTTCYYENIPRGTWVFFKREGEALSAAMQRLRATIHGSSSVGARTKTSENMEATAEQLEKLAKGNRLAALRHPNASKEQLVRWLHVDRDKGLLDRLAALEENPILPLFWLEGPPPEDDPLAVALWNARSMAAKARYAQLVKKASPQQLLDWAEAEIRAELPELAKKRPALAEKFREALFLVPQLGNSITRDEDWIRVQDYSNLRFESYQSEFIKGIAWALYYWIMAHRYVFSNLELARQSAETAANNVYTLRHPLGDRRESWPWYKELTVSFQDHSDALEKFLSQGKVGATSRLLLPSSVAGRTKVADDPSAKGAKLDALAKRDRLAALRHPNATPEQMAEWMRSRSKNADELIERVKALQENPALPLLLLEDRPKDDPFLSLYWEGMCRLENASLSALLDDQPIHVLVQLAWKSCKPLVPLYRKEFPDNDTAEQLMQHVEEFMTGDHSRVLEIYIQREATQIFDPIRGLGYKTTVYVANALNNFAAGVVNGQRGDASRRIRLENAIRQANIVLFHYEGLSSLGWNYYKLRYEGILHTIQVLRGILSSATTGVGSMSQGPKKQSKKKNPVGKQLWEAGGAYPLAFIGAGEDLTRIKEPPSRKSPSYTSQFMLQPPSSTVDIRYGSKKVTPGYFNIMQVVKEATPEEKDFWKNWYQFAHQDVVKLATKHGYPTRLVAAITAVLSPNNSWPQNLAVADQVLSGRRRKISAYPDNVKKAVAMLTTWKTDQVKGPKVTAFYESLANPKKTAGDLVIDGHMINLWRGKKEPLHALSQPSKREHAQIRADYTQVAHDLGMSPQGLQALAWYLWRYIVEKPMPPVELDAFIRMLGGGMTERPSSPRRPSVTQPLRHREDIEDITRQRLEKISGRRPKVGKQLWEAGGALPIAFIGKKGRIGGKEELDDPSLSPERLEAMAKDYPRAVVRHPNIDFGLWRRLAQKYPQQAMENEMVLLWPLEDPDYQTEIDKIRDRFGSKAKRKQEEALSISHAKGWPRLTGEGPDWLDANRTRAETAMAIEMALDQLSHRVNDYAYDNQIPKPQAKILEELLRERLYGAQSRIEELTDAEDWLDRLSRYRTGSDLHLQTLGTIAQYRDRLHQFPVQMLTSAEERQGLFRQKVAGKPKRVVKAKKKQPKKKALKALPSGASARFLLPSGISQ